MIATVFGLFVVIGAVPWPQGSLTAVIPLVVLDVFVITVLIFKGKYFMSLFSLFIPFVGWFGAIRLARPNSRWARKRYADNPKKQAKSLVRGERWDRRRIKFQNVIAGAPDSRQASVGQASGKNPGPDPDA